MTLNTNQACHVVHVSSAHPSNDVRIVYRQCKSLERAGFRVSLVVDTASDKPSFPGLNIIKWRRPKRRITRMFLGSFQVAVKAFALKPDIVHFHDPELLFWMALISLGRTQVVYDVHENLKQGLTERKCSYFERLLTATYLKLERLLTCRMHLVLAEDSYTTLYANFRSPRVVVRNYPDLSILAEFRNPLRHFDAPRLFYMGSLSEERGFYEMLQLCTELQPLGAKIDIVGEVPPKLVALPHIHSAVLDLQRSGALRLWGRLSLEEGYRISMDSNLGLCLLYPISNYMHSLPTKLLEYMAIGLPCLTSDIPLYKSIVEGHSCGCATALNDIRDAAHRVAALFRDEAQREVLSEWSKAGIAAAELNYSWEVEEKVLIRLYQRLGATAISRRFRSS